MSEGAVGVIFSVSEEDTCTGVDAVFRRLVRWREPVTTADGTRVAIPREGRSIEDQTIDLLVPTEQKIQGVRADTAVYGEQTLTYDVPGMLWLTTDDGDTLTAVDLTQYIRDAGDVIIDRRGWGGVFGEIEVLDTVAGLPGDYLDLTVPHQVNARTDQTPKAQRGGTRKVQIVGRTPHAGTATLQLEDAGNLAQTLPTQEEPPAADAVPVPEFTLAASVDDPLTVATATVTNDTDLEDFGAVVEWEYLVQTATPDPTDSGTAFGPLALGFGVDAIDTPAVPTGSTVWVRARAHVVSTGERSAWGSWQSLVLGPDSDGTGGTLPPFLLALSIDSGGLLSAEATSLVAAITKVYFVAGADGGAAPSFADILAGATDASGPPFTAAALATMAAGETRTVGAIGADVLGNRTTAIFASITRGTAGGDPGSSDGRPGNTGVFHFVTEAGGTYVIGPHPSAATPLDECGEWRVPSFFSTHITAWAHVAVVGASGATLDVEVFASGSWISTGIAIPLDELGPHIISSPLPDGASAPNARFRGVAVGGDDEAMPEIYNFAFALTVEEPGDLSPPVTSDLPSGAPWGTIIHDINARSLLGVETDAAAMTAWADDSVSSKDAFLGTLQGQTAPHFRESGWDGVLPCVEFDDSTSGMVWAMPSNNSFTHYVVTRDIDEASVPAGKALALLYANRAGSAFGKELWAVQGGGLLGQSAGETGMEVNDSGFVGSWVWADLGIDLADPHIWRWAYSSGGGQFWLWIDGVLLLSGTCLPGPTASTFFWMGYTSTGGVTGAGETSAPGGMKVAREVMYDTSHITPTGSGGTAANGKTPIETILSDYWGTP